MLFNKKFYNKYFSYTKYLLILFSFWISINTGSKYVEIDSLSWHISNNTFNFLRSILPYVFLIYYFIYEVKIYKNKSFNFDIIFKLFFIYGSLQILGLIYKFDDFYEHYWVVCLFSVLIFYNFIKEKNDEKLFNYIFFINIIAILLVFSIFTFITFKENILSENLLYNSSTFSIIYNTENLPRSTGLSRMALVLFIFFNSLYFSKIFKKKINICLNIACIILVSIIFLFQSRGIFLSYLLIFVGLIIFYRLKNIIQYFCLMILIPILVFVSYPNIKNILMEIYGQKKGDLIHHKKTIKLKNFEINIRNNLLTTKEELNENSFLNKIYSISNNRVHAWDLLLQIFFKNKLNEKMINELLSEGYDVAGFEKIKKKNFFTGYGPQADRHILYNNPGPDKSELILGPFGFNASNGIIYSLVCSGLLGMICFLTINLIIFKKIITLLIHHFKKSNLNSKPFLSSAIFSILFLQMRVLFENSFSVFGVDLLIFMSSYIVIQNEYRKLNN